MWSIYVLYNPERIIKQFYIGLTNNIAARVRKHKDGNVYFTHKDSTDWRLIYCKNYLSKKDAAKREHNLKYHGQAFRQLKERIRDSLKMAK